MSDEPVVNEPVNEPAPQYTPEQITAMAAELERLKSHHGKFLEETRVAKQRAAELEEQKRISEEESLKKAGEFQKLYESESEKAARIAAELEQERAERREEKNQQKRQAIELDAMTLVRSHAVDDGSIELLAEKAQQFAVYTDEGVKYEIGGVRVDSAKMIETLSAKYPRLFKGDGAMGGGALGGKGGRASDGSNSKADEAKKKGDVNGFLAAHLNQ